jgi:TIR domain
VPSRGIFLSYRRNDAAPYARLLQFQLRERFPDVHVFMDLDSIDAGTDFAEVIGEAIDSCTVLVALIGRQWETITDEHGRRRLDDPDDYVRFEVQAALERGVRVIPILVDGAAPLRQERLPAELRKLARLNALELSYGRYEYDADRLLDLIQRVLGDASNPAGSAGSSFTATAEVPRSGDSATDQATEQNDGAGPTGRRTIRLMIDAKRAAESITDSGMKARALGRIASALAATDADRAENIARFITDHGAKARALADIAKALAASGLDHSTRAYADAESIALTIARSRNRNRPESNTLCDILGALAATAPDRAESIARSIKEQAERASALAGIARTVAATNPADAARLLADAQDIAQSIAGGVTEQYSKARALTDIAKGLAAIDPNGAAWVIADAEGIAQSIAQTAVDERWKASALTSIARGLAAIDPDGAVRIIAEAENIAPSITDKNLKVLAVIDIVEALAPTDPDRAEHIAQSIEPGNLKARALAAVAGALAPTDPDRAEHIAQSIEPGNLKARALAAVAGALAPTDPDRAERIAQSVADGFWKVQALVALAEA